MNPVKRGIIPIVIKNDCWNGRCGIRGYSVFTKFTSVKWHPKNRKWLYTSTSCNRVPALLCQTTTKRQIVTSGPILNLPEFACLADYIFHSAQAYSNEKALIDYDTKEYLSFAQLQEDIEYLSSNLLRHGVEHSDVITYFGTNSVELVQLLCAANRLGAIVSLANAQLTSDELQLQLRISGTKMLVTATECATVAKTAAASFQLKPPFVIGAADGCRPFSCLKDRSEKLKVPGVALSENDVALIPFSSGTTGMPKGVQLSNKNLIAEIHALRHHSFIPLTPFKDVSICALPMVHIAGLVVGCLNALAQGATTVLLSKFNPPAFLSAIQDYMGTFTLIAPPIMNMLAKDPIVSEYYLSSTTLYSGAAPLDKTLTEMVAERLGIDCIRQGYGMTETSPATHTSPLEGWKFGSVGVPLPNTHCKVVSVDNGLELGPNEEGELWVRGPQVMLGYHGNEEATRNAFSADGTWLKTGDVGYFDQDGHYFISDRIKDVIKYKGYQIAPAYLESVLLTHPHVIDAAVVGVKGANGEEVPLAWLVVKDSRTVVTVDEINAFVNERVAPYKRLRGGVRFVDAIPKSASGKILKRIIREEDSK